MFCPKCGTENPESGKFCRSCGTDLGNVSEALNKPAASPMHFGRHNRAKGPSWEGAMSKLFMGAAFLVVSIILGVSGMGRGWWFWLLLPAFGMIGSGLAHYIQLKKSEAGAAQPFSPPEHRNLNSAQVSGLPPAQTEFVAPESRYRTGDLVPPSVTDSTTRHLEMNNEGETMTLPKK